MEVKKPNRVSHTYEQTINGTIKDIMPLYCPVRELDWCENWNPKSVYSNSGLVEKTVFLLHLREMMMLYGLLQNTILKQDM